jgi:hypothetical protein
MKLKHPTTNEIVDLDNDSAKEAIMSGFVPVDGQLFLRDQDGKLLKAPTPQSIVAAAREGLGEIVTPFDLKVQKLDEEGVIGDIKAAGLGLARGATFGLSDVALTKSGLVEGETLKAIEEASPIVSTAGEAASFLIPGLGQAKAAGVAAKAGVAAGKMVAGATAKKVAEKGVEAVVRGGAAGFGQGVSDIAMEDIPLASSAAAATAAKSALVGALFDGVVTGATVGAGKAGSALIQQVPGVSGTSWGSKAYSKVASKMSGLDEVTLTKMMDKQTRDKAKEYLAKEGEILAATRSGIEEHAKRVEREIKDSYSILLDDIKTRAVSIEDIASTGNELSDVFSSTLSNISSSSIKKDVKSIADYLKKTFVTGKTPQETSVYVDAMYEAKQMLNDIRRDLYKKTTGTLFRKDKEAIEGLRGKMLGYFAKVGGLGDDSTANLLELDSYYAALQDYLKVAKSITGKDGKNLSIGKAQRALNGKAGQERLDDYIEASKNLEEKIPDYFATNSAGKNIIANHNERITKIRDLISNYSKVNETATALRKIGSVDVGDTKYLLGALGFGYGGLVPAAIGFLGSKAAAPKGIISIADKMVSAEKMLSNAVKKYSNLASPTKMFTDKTAVDLSNLWSNPADYKEHLSMLSIPDTTRIESSVSPANSIDPRLGTLASSKVGEVQAYLQAKAPKLMAPSRPNARTLAPNKMEMRRYTSIVTAALDPVGTITRAAEAGASLNEVQLKTIRDLYPDLYTSISSTSSDRVEVVAGRDTSGISYLQSAWSVPSEEGGKGGQDMEMEMPLTSTGRAERR